MQWTTISWYSLWKWASVSTTSLSSDYNRTWRSGGHSMYDVEMPSQPSSSLCVECHRVSLGSHTVHYVHCRLDLSDWKPWLVTTHVCRRYATVYGSCRPAAIDAPSSKISECVGAVASWMQSNRLSLNCDKTEVVWCATSRRQHQLPCSALSVDRLSPWGPPSISACGLMPANGFAVFRRPTTSTESLTTSFP